MLPRNLRKCKIIMPFWIGSGTNFSKSNNAGSCSHWYGDVMKSLDLKGTAMPRVFWQEGNVVNYFDQPPPPIAASFNHVDHFRQANDHDCRQVKTKNFNKKLRLAGFFSLKEILCFINDQAGHDQLHFSQSLGQHCSMHSYNAKKCLHWLGMKVFCFLITSAEICVQA